MNTIEQVLLSAIKNCISTLYGQEVNDSLIQLQKTRKDFNGDITLVVFPLLKTSKKSPEITAKEIGQFLKENSEIVSDFEVVKGFLNLAISNSFWLGFLKNILAEKNTE
jgi:arginyl-tRNA synthetase